MKYLILLFTLCGAASAQSLSCTPTDGTVVKWDVVFTCTPTSLPTMFEARLYDDAMLVDVSMDKVNGAWTMHVPNIAYTDQCDFHYYAEAYDAAGTLLATSATQTLRIDNVGLCASMGLSDSGHGARQPCGNSAWGTTNANCQVSGTLTVSPAINYGTITPGNSMTGYFSIDGMQPSAHWHDTIVDADRMLCPNALINTTTHVLTCPYIIGASGDQMGVTCYSYSQGCPSDPMPTPLTFGQSVWICVSGGNTLKLYSTSAADAKACGSTGLILISDQGTAGDQVAVGTGIVAWNPTGQCAQAGNNCTIDTTRFRNGVHKLQLSFEFGLPNSPSPADQITFCVPWANFSGSTLTQTNLPIWQDTGTGSSGTAAAVTWSSSMATCGATGTVPSQFSGTVYAVMNQGGINSWCFSSSPGGTCITPTGGAGTLTGTARLNESLYDNSGAQGGNLDTLTTSVVTVDIENATSTVYDLQVDSSGSPACGEPIVLKVADSCTLVVRAVKADGTTTILSNSNLLFGTTSSSIVTVNSSGVVTAVAEGDARISIIDNTDDRSRLLHAIVKTATHYTQFPHFTGGHGMQTTLGAGQNDLYPVASFNGPIADLLNHNPFPGDIIRNLGFNGLQQGYDNYYSGLASNQIGLSDFLTNTWNQGTSNPYSFATFTDPYTNANHLQPWKGGDRWFWSYGQSGLNFQKLCGPGQLLIRNRRDERNILSRIISDTAPYSIGMEPNDEQSDACYGVDHNGPAKPIAKMVSSISNGDNGLGMGIAGGLTSISISGNTATVTMKSFINVPAEASSLYMEITGATTANLNGPVTLISNSAVAAYDDPVGVYYTSFQFTIPRTVTCSPCNFSSDPNLQLNWFKNWGGIAYPSAVFAAQGFVQNGTCTVTGGTLTINSGFTFTSTVEGIGVLGQPTIYFNGNGYTIGATLSSTTATLLSPPANAGPVACSIGMTNLVVTGTNLITVNFNGHPFTNGRSMRLFNCSTSSLNGIYIWTNVNGNSGTMSGSGLTNGTYTSSSGCLLDEIVQVPPDFYLNLVKGWINDPAGGTTGCGGSVCPNRIPTGGSVTNGSGALPSTLVMSYGTGTGVADFIPHEFLTQFPIDRYGPSAFDFRSGDVIHLRTMSDGSSVRSHWGVTQPTIGSAHLGTVTCYKAVFGNGCIIGMPNKDKFQYLFQTPLMVFRSALTQVMAGNAGYAGLKGYSWDYIPYNSPISPGSLPQPTYQDASTNMSDTTHPDSIAAFGSLVGTVQRNFKCLISPLVTAPDPGGWLLETMTHQVTATGTTCTMLANWSTRPEPYHLDLTSVHQGGKLWVYTTTHLGTTVVQQADATVVNGTINPNTVMTFVSQSSTTPDEVPTYFINQDPTKVTGATHLTVTIRHYRDDKFFNHYDCGTTGKCSFPMDVRNVGGWRQDVYWNASGLVTKGALEWQTPQ